MMACRNGHTGPRDKRGDCRECRAAAVARNRAKNPKLHQQRLRAWEKKNPDKVKGYARRKRGLPEPARACPIVCECCGRPPGKISLALDHDHVTGHFRGWLCKACNLALGLLGDTEDGVYRALTYLRITSTLCDTSHTGPDVMVNDGSIK